MYLSLNFRRLRILRERHLTSLCSYMRRNVTTGKSVTFRILIFKTFTRKSRIFSILEKKKGTDINTSMNSLDFKKAYDSVRREILYNILIEFGIPMKLVRVIKMCLTETCSRVRVGKNLSDMFSIRNCHCFSTLLWSMLLGRFR